MKTKIFSILLMLAFSMTAWSQQNQQPRLSAQERAAKQTEMMKKRLNLTDEQVSKVSEINLRYANKMDENRKKFQKAKEEMNKKDKELQGVFTSEQYQKYSDHKEKVKDRARNKMRQRGLE